jgi:CubicO group peptidase (beta-lactamase class C family)
VGDGAEAPTLGGYRAAMAQWAIATRPTADWEVGPPDPDVDADRLTAVVAELMGQPPELGLTQALVVVHRGTIVAEAYGPDVDATTQLISWSMAKSITHALVGIAVGDGLLDLDTPAPVAAWRGDGRREITLQHLLNMRDGLDFAEDYVGDEGVSDVLEMLFGEGKDDHAGYAIARPLAHPPGSVWSYSSGTSNIVSRLVGDVVGGGAAATRAFIVERLFEPIGMTADARFDQAGTFVGSSYVFASARDFARFGALYLHDGLWNGERLLPEGWLDHARRWTAHDPDNGFDYGAHWWLWPDQPRSLAAHGYEGQYTIVLPEKDAVVVRLGRSPVELRPALVAKLRELITTLP